MSEAPPSAIDAALARLAELELAWVEHVHAQGMATTDRDEINAIGRTIHRADRALRQTLWMQARRERQRAEDDRRALREAAPPPPRNVGRFVHPHVAARANDLFEAIGRIACAMYSDAPMGEDPERDAVLAAQDRLVNEEAERADFLARDLEDHVRAHCEALDLPTELAHCWLGLPPAPWGDPVDNYVPGPVDDHAGPVRPVEPTQDELRQLLKRAKPRRRHNTS